MNETKILKVSQAAYKEIRSLLIKKGNGGTFYKVKDDGVFVEGIDMSDLTIIPDKEDK